ncbi:MAG: YfcE family phosphodiesterase [Thermoflexales bacterium]|nr:YfcE family phosphodiesterase [Thermoflexales bacterium]
MKIGILSDTHDNLEAVWKARDLFAAEGITTLLHCGDVCGPAVVEALDGFTVYFAQGNQERIPALREAVAALQGGRLAVLHTLVLNGRSIALLHGDDRDTLCHLIASGMYAYVVHGHTHRRRDQRRGRVRVINPGALGGVRWETPSICTLDLDTDDVKFHIIP